MNPKRILLHPDVFYTWHSGAIAAREAARQLTGLGCTVGIFSHDEPGKEDNPYPWFRRIPYRGTANYRPAAYRQSFAAVLDEFKPDSVFFIGGIVNTPMVYLDICRERGIRTVFMLLVQDFYCARLHAGLGTGSCTRCLEGPGIHAFLNNCGDKQPRPLPYLLNYQVVKRMIRGRMRKIDRLIGSSDEQLGFYRQMGVPAQRTVKLPLFFDQRRLPPVTANSENYFVIIGQYRHEKGIHLVSRILGQLRDGVTVKMLFFDQREADRFLGEYPENGRHVSSGKLILMPGVTMTTGAVEVIAGSAGVINPSIWATTTEFVLLEVLGLSKPIITFDVGIHREVIEHRVNGLCVKSGDFVGMAAEIHRLLDDPGSGEAIGREALKLYHRLTDASQFTPVLNEIFDLER